MSRQSSVSLASRGIWGRSEPGVSKPPSQRHLSAPVIRIERPVLLRGSSYHEWSEYLANFAQNHRQLAVKNLGAVVCTHLESKDLNAMLAAKYPGEYANPKKTKSLHRAFARSFQGYMASSLRAIRDEEVQTTLAERFFREPTDPELEIPWTRHHNMWAVGTMKVAPHFRTAGAGHALVASLTDNEVLWDEGQAIRDYCKHEEKLDINLIKTVHLPHLTLAQTARNLSDICITPASLLPAEVILGAPIVWHEAKIIPLSEQSRIGSL